MPRVSQRPEVILALSPFATATALGVSYDHIREAIDSGKLPVRVIGIKHRILVRDIENFFRSLPAPRKRRTKRTVPNA